MNVIVVGAGNAGRPVARLLNYAGHKVKITDPKNIEDFHMDVQKTLNLMEKEGVELDLGVFEPSLDGIDTVYLSPTVPENSPAYKIIAGADLDVFSNEDFGRLADSFIKPDIIGITGSVGKTSTTHMVSEIFRAAGYKVWLCSSMTQNLVSEVIVDGIIKGLPDKADIAVLELPHGTAGLMGELRLKVGALLNIYEEHLSEFGGSMEKYTERKMFITKHSENFITSIHCKDTVKEARPDAIFYAMVKDLPGYDDDKKQRYFDKIANFEEIAIGENQVCNFIGDSAKGAIEIGYKFRNKNDELLKGSFTSEFHMMSYYYENAVAATAIAMAYGLDLPIIKKGLSNFKGLAAPVLYDVDLKRKDIIMEDIPGPMIKDIMPDLAHEKRKELAVAIGETIRAFHDVDIIHGDLTGSNMILVDDNVDDIKNNLAVFDFGLGRYSDLLEDKAVDLLVLKKSFQSVDYEIASETFDWILDAYDSDSSKMRDKISEIQSRGRYTH